MKLRMETFLRRIREIIQNLMARAHKSEAEEAAPARTPDELKTLADRHKQALRLNPEDADLHFKLGEVYVEMGRFGDALFPLREALRFVPDHPKAPFQLGRACLEIGREEEALELFQQTLEKEPESLTVKDLLARTHINLSETCGRLRRFDDSMMYIKEALKIVPDFGSAYLSLGILYRDLGRYQDALDNINKALKLDKNLAVDAHYNLGAIYSKLKKERQAIKHYKEAIKVDPRAAMPNLNLGLLYMKKKKYKESADCLQTAIKYSPRLAADAYYKLGWVLMQLKRVWGAVEPLREAFKLSPDDERVGDLFADALSQTTPALRRSEKFEEELETLVEALHANPTHCEAHHRLGEAYDRIGEGYKAIKHAIIAKHYFAENHEDDKLTQSIKTIQLWFKKYRYRQEDFAKVRIPRK